MTKRVTKRVRVVAVFVFSLCVFLSHWLANKVESEIYLTVAATFAWCSGCKSCLVVEVATLCFGN